MRGGMMGAHHELHATPASVHWGFFEAGLPPVLEIESGDESEIEIEIGW